MLENIQRNARITTEQQNELRTHLRGRVTPVKPDGTPGTEGTSYGTPEVPVQQVHSEELYVGGRQLIVGALEVVPGVQTAPDVPGLEGAVGTLGINSENKVIVRAGTILVHGTIRTEIEVDTLLPIPPTGADQSATALAVVDTTKQWGYDSSWAHSALTGGWLPVFGDAANGTLSVAPRPCCGHVNFAALPSSGTTGERRLLSSGEWVAWTGSAWVATTEVLIGVVEYTTLSTGVAAKVMPARTRDFDNRVTLSVPPEDVELVSGLTTTAVKIGTRRIAYDCRLVGDEGREVCSVRTVDLNRYDANRDSEPVWGYTQNGIVYQYAAAPITLGLGDAGNETRDEADLSAAAITEALYYGAPAAGVSASGGYLGWAPSTYDAIHPFLPAVAIADIQWVARGSTI